MVFLYFIFSYNIQMMFQVATVVFVKVLDIVFSIPQQCRLFLYSTSSATQAVVKLKNLSFFISQGIHQRRIRRKTV